MDVVTFAQEAMVLVGNCLFDFSRKSGFSSINQVCQEKRAVLGVKVFSNPIPGRMKAVWGSSDNSTPATRFIA